MVKLVHVSPMSKTQMTLGENMRRLREAAKLSQAELAALARLNLKQIQRMEAGIGDTGVSKVKAVVIALGCTADQLLFDEDELGQDGDLRPLFQQLCRMNGQDRETAKDVIRALVMQHQNRELLKHA